MAARPLLLRLAFARSTILNSAFRSVDPPRRAFQLSVAKLTATVATSPPSAGNPIITRPPASPLPAEEAANETKHAAFLGEADSNDGHEAFKDAYGAPAPALDAQNSAFLGEADSDDGFEAQRAVDGDQHEPLDASQSAYLGEADSDDGFESDVEVHPEDHRHNIEDTSGSGLHGQSGELDQRVE
ncbi:uncharacterized protein A1O9_10577 [Exophiala aquamarina CBS 119918]|uniref:Uncharacterized protein n=1 Tax=Exophiala aquamarina CBS 119918 TaxID=1182545 RepID=A0A072P1P2_9EURO|nr:uncharacterized protein A1O9_10577 [Exophiala aquamarina CBS 119918]KEF53602.1 hypothetical protein A1O9_10577 [Exophiala aquamarina CBS 119918]